MEIFTFMECADSKRPRWIWLTSGVSFQFIDTCPCDYGQQPASEFTAFLSLLSMAIFSVPPRSISPLFL